VTRRDFEAIARAIAASTDTVSGGAMVFKEALVSRLADYLATTNPRFDRGRFYLACYRNPRETRAQELEEVLKQVEARA